MARGTVQSIAAHSASTMFDGRFFAVPPGRVPFAVGQQAEILRTLGDQQVDRQQHDQR